MRELSRMELYTWTLNMNLENESIVNEEFNVLINNNRQEFYNLLSVNITLLQRIEEAYLPNGQSQSENLDMDDFERIFNENKANVMESLGNNFENIIDKKSGDNSIYAFKNLLQSLLKYNDNILNSIIKKKNKIISFRDVPGKRVFLSYAYKDRLYTLCLYFYMLSKGINLYVDWLYCDALKDGKEIKRNLREEIKNTDQFLFLRTMNSELSLRGGNTVRQWCAWEFGAFYNTHGGSSDDKFYIELYDRKGIKKTKEKIFYDGLLKLTDIVSGRLIGV